METGNTEIHGDLKYRDIWRQEIKSYPYMQTGNAEIHGDRK
jgi:hypothetical protein